MNAHAAFEQFRHLPPVEPHELVGLWKGRGIATGHPLDGVLENLGWFGKRFTADLKADALLFRSGEQRLTAVDPSLMPLPLALRFHRLGRTRAARNLFSYLQRRLSAKGPVATLRLLSFEGVLSAAMVYDRKPITDHFRRIDADKLMGMMIIEGDARRYFFELERVTDPLVEAG
jgi:hypothetical protein